MDVTLIVALIAAISAILAPVITCLITSWNSYKLKTIDLFFNAKLDAYKNFIKTSSTFPPNPSAEILMELQNASAYAMLFSSSSTQGKIAVYCSELVNYSCTSNGIQSLDVLHAEAILAMQNELYDFRKYRKYRKRHNNS